MNWTWLLLCCVVTRLSCWHINGEIRRFFHEVSVKVRSRLRMALIHLFLVWFNLCYLLVVLTLHVVGATEWCISLRLLSTHHGGVWVQVGIVERRVPLIYAVVVRIISLGAQLGVLASVLIINVTVVWRVKQCCVLFRLLRWQGRWHRMLVDCLLPKGRLLVRLHSSSRSRDVL